MQRRSILAILVVVMVSACGSGPSAPSETPTSSGPPSPTATTGTVNVRITDSPYGSAKAVLITFSEVSILRDGGSWTRVPFPDGTATTWTCDLKKLQNGAQDLLAAGTMPIGGYSMTRLRIQSARIYFDNVGVSDTPCARTIPPPAGLVYDIAITEAQPQVNGSYPSAAGAATTLLIDFDGDASITSPGAGTYFMNPVIRLVSVQ